MICMAKLASMTSDVNDNLLCCCDLGRRHGESAVWLQGPSVFERKDPESNLHGLL